MKRNNDIPEIDQDIVIEIFRLFYEREPNFSNENDVRLLTQAMYVVDNLNIYLYASSLEGLTPEYKINQEGYVESRLISQVAESIEELPENINIIENPEEVTALKKAIDEFLERHPNITLNDIIKFELLTKAQKPIPEEMSLTVRDQFDITQLLSFINERPIHPMKILPSYAKRKGII